MLSDLTAIISNRELTPQEINRAAASLVNLSIEEKTKANFLRTWAERGETAAELAACAEAFLPHAVDPGVRGSWNGRALLDCCGTGGGGLNLLNISTGLMFILSALDIPVVKHGNRGQTKKSGSADVLEALGIKIDLPPDRVAECLEQVGCDFLFAPAYHPSFRAVSAVRRQLAAAGQRTIFNLLGPLLNPARPDARLVGVFPTEHLPLYCATLEAMHCPRFSVVSGHDGASGLSIGEVSAHGITFIASTINPGDGAPLDRLEWIYSETPPQLDSLFVTDADDSARRLLALLPGEEHGLARETLLLNSAIASWTHGTASSLEEGLTQSTQALDSGHALERLENWQRFSEK